MQSLRALKEIARNPEVEKTVLDCSPLSHIRRNSALRRKPVYLRGISVPAWKEGRAAVFNLAAAHTTAGSSIAVLAAPPAVPAGSQVPQNQQGTDRQDCQRLTDTFLYNGLPEVLKVCNESSIPSLSCAEILVWAGQSRATLLACLHSKRPPKLAARHQQPFQTRFAAARRCRRHCRLRCDSGSKEAELPSRLSR